MIKCCLIMVGGIGGYVFFGIVVVDMLVKCGWYIDWLGIVECMEV